MPTARPTHERRRRAAALALVALLAAPMALAAGASEPTPERAAALKRLLDHDCGSCHGLTRKGGLGSPLLPDRLAARSDADLAHVIRNGMPGTPMPPWGSLLSDQDVDFLVREIRRSVP
ncbi:MAG: cytochrome c [Alphaproteobacteria bacterium]|nr:cytochrome c [Alphaproteobacteria bacterium]